MKKFKSIASVFAALLLVVSLSGCGSNKNVEGTLPEIMEKINEKMYTDIDETERPILVLVDILATEDDRGNKFTEEDILATVEYTIGTTDIEYKEIYESRPTIGVIPYSVVLVRMEQNANIEAAKTAIKENVNPAKWVCGNVDSKDVIVKSKGDLIILIMIENETLREKIEEGFDNL